MNKFFERISNAFTCLFRDKYVLVKVSPTGNYSYSEKMNVTNNEWISLAAGICDNTIIGDKKIIVKITNKD